LYLAPSTNFSFLSRPTGRNSLGEDLAEEGGKLPLAKVGRTCSGDESTFHLPPAAPLLDRTVSEAVSSENQRGTPGRGQVPWRDFFRALADVNYQGIVTIGPLCNKNETLCPRQNQHSPRSSSQNISPRHSDFFLGEANLSRARWKKKAARGELGPSFGRFLTTKMEFS
jgi:hypothetical protein